MKEVAARQVALGAFIDILSDPTRYKVIKQLGSTYVHIRLSGARTGAIKHEVRLL